MKATRGVIFNVQHYSIHDGPGIRCTVFMKGCPLRCLWCQNPESQVHGGQLMVSTFKCDGCGACAGICPRGAVSVVDGKAHTDRTLCGNCGECANVCHRKGRSIAGKEVTAEEVFREVVKDAKFFRRSGGGVTLSGGEPLAQPDFSAAILTLSKQAHIHTAIETCGYAGEQAIRAVFSLVDLFLFDLKHMDGEAHRRLTGVDNKLILENIQRAKHEFNKQVIARIPIIPNYNDSEENIRATSEFVLDKLGADIPANLLPYHRLGETKNEQLEKRVKDGFCSDPPTMEHMERLKSIVMSYGLRCQIGG